MEKIGEKLKNARELKKLTIKDVSKETNISPRYLSALEEEEFDKIPGEPYLLGFLRNYAEFLKMDGDEIIQSYKGYKIGESATPLEELTKPTRVFALPSFPNIFTNNKRILYVAGGAVILILIIWFFSSMLSNDVKVNDDDSVADIKKEYTAAKDSLNNENIRNLTLTDDRGYILVYKNETVQFLVENKEVMFLLKDIKDNAVVVELIPGNQYETLEIEKTQAILVKDSPREVILTLKGLTENRAKIFVMLGKRTESAATDLQKDIAAESSAGTSIVAQNRKNLKIIFEAEFLRKTYLELYLDGMQKKKGIIPAGIKERWEASEYIQLKIGNAGGLKANINGKTYTFGLPGQVANKIITWQMDPKTPNLYHIVIKDW
ncbi:MAG: helix-turn-helix domain-containing protein [Spirochaetes bacterium]|nr:helix-turn-helix domain-containing protein [Spirochaetota bacterium]